MTFRTALALAAVAVAPLAAQPAPPQLEAVQVDLAEVIRRGPPSQHAILTEMPRPGSRLSDAEKERLRQEAMRMPPSAALMSRQEPAKRAPDFEDGFDSLDAVGCCTAGTVVPPDSHLAAGPGHLIAVVNASFAIYDKDGTDLTGKILFSTFATSGACSTNPFDPNALYDEEADRFIMAWDGSGTRLCIAVTQTANPLGVWTIYSINAQPLGGEFSDYPHLGVGDTHIVAGTNQFNGNVPGGFEGRVWAIDKAQAYAATLSTASTASTGPNDGTPQPLHLHGKLQGTWPALGGANFFLTNAFDGCTYDVWKWSPPAAPTSAATFDLCAATAVAGGLPVESPQSGGGNLQGNDWRGRGFEYRNGSGWFTDSISCNPGSGTVNCVRWAQVNLVPVTPTLTQAGVFGSNGVHRIFPDLAVDTLNNMAIGYSRTSAATFPSVYFTGREAGDAVGTLQSETLLKAGEVSYTPFDSAPHRWGDYSSMTIDPNGVTFWYLGEYSKNIVETAEWGNWIGRVSYVLFADSFEVGSTAAWSFPPP